MILAPRQPTANSQLPIVNPPSNIHARVSDLVHNLVDRDGTHRTCFIRYAFIAGALPWVAILYKHETRFNQYAILIRSGETTEEAAIQLEKGVEDFLIGIQGWTLRSEE